VISSLRRGVIPPRLGQVVGNTPTKIVRTQSYLMGCLLPEGPEAELVASSISEVRGFDDLGRQFDLAAGL
jgi:hypothetical protein